MGTQEILSTQESKVLQQKDTTNKVKVISYLDSDTELEKEKEIDYESESSESNRGKAIISDEEEDLDLMEDTPIEVTTQNDEPMIKSLIQKTMNTDMKDNEDPEQIVIL